VRGAFVAHGDVLADRRRQCRLQSGIATDAAISTPEMRERLKQIGADVAPPEHRSQDYLSSFIESEITKWAVMIKAAGLTAE
jgi:tripartite-type tricarboxylate transporter receptor subunit TctC